MNGTIIHIFKPNPLRNILQLIVFSIGFITIPAYALIMSYMAGTLSNYVMLVIGVFLLMGISFCISVLRKKIVMYRNEMVIYSFLKKKSIQYKNIRSVSFRSNLVGAGYKYNKVYYFVLTFKNKFTEEEFLKDGYKVGGIELSYNVNLKTLDSIESKYLFLNTIEKSNPSVIFDDITTAYKNGEDPEVMKHGQIRD